MALIENKKFRVLPRKKRVPFFASSSWLYSCRMDSRTVQSERGFHRQQYWPSDSIAMFSCAIKKMPTFKCRPSAAAGRTAKNLDRIHPITESVVLPFFLHHFLSYYFTHRQLLLFFLLSTFHSLLFLWFTNSVAGYYVSNLELTEGKRQKISKWKWWWWLSLNSSNKLHLITMKVINEKSPICFHSWYFVLLDRVHRLMHISNL